MTIIIDDREPESIRTLGDAIRRLNCDACIVAGDGIIRVERKTLTDLMKTLDEKRLNTQLANVDELVIQDNDEWVPRGIFERMYNDGRLRNTINGLQEHHVVKFCTDDHDYIRVLRRIEAKLADGTYATCRVHARFDTTFDTPEIGFISGLPQVGEDKAKKVMEFYRTPLNALIAAPHWDIDIPGVGHKTVNAVIRFIVGGGTLAKGKTDTEENNTKFNAEYKAQIAGMMDLAKPRVQLRRRRKKDDAEEAKPVDMPEMR